MTVKELKKLPKGTLFTITRITSNQVFEIYSRNPFTIRPFMGDCQDPICLSIPDDKHIYSVLNEEDINLAMGKLMSTPTYFNLEHKQNND